MRSGTKFGGSVSPKLLRKNTDVTCSKSKEKDLGKKMFYSCPGPLPWGPRPFPLPPSHSHTLSLPRMRHTMVTTKD